MISRRPYWCPKTIKRRPCIDPGHVGENVLYESIVIRHFHIFHNAPYLPPQFLHNLCFTFLVGITAVPRNIGNFFFLGGRGGGRLISLIIGNVEVAYGRITLAVATLGPLTAFSGSGIFLVWTPEFEIRDLEYCRRCRKPKITIEVSGWRKN